MKKFTLFTFAAIIIFFIVINIFISIFGPLDLKIRNLNKSFQSAESIAPGFYMSVTQKSDEDLFFQFTVSSLNYVTIYTTGSTDTVLRIYDSTYTFINLYDKPDDRCMQLTSEPNFGINFYAKGNKTYYIVLSVAKSGLYDFHFTYGNYFWAPDINNLVSGYSSVVSYNIQYKFTEKLFQDEFKEAAAVWNELGKVNIEETSRDVDTTLLIQVVSDENNQAWAWYFPNSEPNVLVFNAYKIYTDGLSHNEIVNLCMHEIGHTLGLEDFNTKTNKEYVTNIMNQGRYSKIQLGPADIAAYRYLWGY